VSTINSTMASGSSARCAGSFCL